MVRIVFLGVGGWISEPFLGFTSILVESRGSAILMDAGEGVYRAMRCCGYDLENIVATVLTHGHGDHVLGIPTLALLSAHRKSKRLKILSIRSVLEAVELLMKAVGIEHILNHIEFTEVLPPEAVQIAHFKLSFVEAPHTVPAISVRVDVDDRCIVFSGDTRYNPRLAEFAKNCNVLIHEASDYSPNAHLYGHSNYIEALDIASRAGVETFVPIHFYGQPKPMEIGHLSREQRLRIYMPAPCTYLEL